MEEKVTRIKPKVLIGVIVGVLILILIILLLVKGCAKKEYLVRFDSNGGSIVEDVVVKENDLVTEPNQPTKDDYIFEGWYSGNDIFDFNTKITKDMTLVAHWRLDQIQLEDQDIALEVSDSEEIVIKYLPANLTKDDLIYTSTDEDIATVNSDGKIKAIKDGTVTIIINSKDGKYTTTCNVTITKKGEIIIEAERITINGNTSVVEGNSIKLTAVIQPENTTNKKVTWKSSDSTIATVDSNGNVRALKPGTVTITATTANGKSTTKTIEVTKEILPTKISITGASEVKTGESIKLSTTIEPSNATNKKLTWKSSNTGIAKVDDTGKVTGVKAGTVTITVTTANGKTATKEIKVSDIEATKITITGASEVYIGDSITLKATITPSNTTNKKVTWSIDNDSIASIDQKGKVTGRKAGKVIVTAKTANGKTTTHTVVIKEKPASYLIVLTAVHQDATDGVAQYLVKITKNGATLSKDEFIGFTYNKKEFLSSTTTIKKADINSSITTATIKLKDGKTVNATVKHIN